MLPVVIAEPLQTCEDDRYNATELFFEKFEVPSLLFAKQPPLALSQCNGIGFKGSKTTGLVVDCGDSGCVAVPVYEGVTLSNAAVRSKVTGRRLTNYMVELLENRGYEFTTIKQREEVKTLKEDYGLVVLHFEEELRQKQKMARLKGGKNQPYRKLYTRKNGEEIEFEHERFRCSEPLFQPRLIGLNEERGLPALCAEAISRCDKSIHTDLFANVFLCGGSSKFFGLSSRLEKELLALFPYHRYRLKVHQEQCSKDSVWLGARSISGFTERVVSRSDYDEYGLPITTRKCI
jgi:actin-related protein